MLLHQDQGEKNRKPNDAGNINSPHDSTKFWGARHPGGANLVAGTDRYMKRT